jgi:hypothetical protein
LDTQQTLVTTAVTDNRKERRGIKLFAYGLAIILIAGFAAWATSQFLVPERALIERQPVETNHGFTPDSMLFISQWQMRTARDGVVLSGEMENVSRDTLEYVELQFALLDTRGNQVGAAHGDYTRLPPGQSMEFRIPIDSPAARQARLLNVITPFSMTYGHAMDGPGAPAPSIDNEAEEVGQDSDEPESDLPEEQS